MGTPDVKQIDGKGGTVSSTSKIAVISPSDRQDVDVNYTFRQVDIVIPRVDGSANCGNISSAVGPFAIDEGLVPAVEPITVVRILNTNTNKIIEEHVRVENGRAMVHGDEVIKGVPGTGSRIDMYFEDPAGSRTGKLFPTGQKKEIFDVPGYGPAEVTVLDLSLIHILEMVSRGIGWSILPEICLKQFDGQITPLYFKDGTPFTRSSHILYKHDYFELPQVKKFIQEVLAREYFMGERTQEAADELHHT